MRYRKLGKTGLNISALGFGAMRLPMLGNQDSFDPNTPINESEASEMVQYALDQGVYYFDTAYGYHGGKSEKFLGKTLKNHRSKIMISTKLPSWMVTKTEDFEKFFTEQLEKLCTDYIDFYLIHGLDRDSWRKMKNLGVLEFFDNLRTGKRIRFAGFSFHDEVKAFKEIVDEYDWSLCLVQYNYYDENFQAGTEGIVYAASRGLGVVVMEPLRGGRLVEKLPPDIQAIWDSSTIKKTPAEMALQWVWDHPEVSTALSGVSTLDQLKDNVRIADKFSETPLSSTERTQIEKVKAAYKSMLMIECTRCGYCMPCPNGVNIPMNFSLYNDMFMFKDPHISIALYNHMMTPEQKASGCSECLSCEDLCPQKILISAKLKEVHEKLAEK
jgi:predicted aldo/keto reductase-like oxidoreductase